MRVLNFKDGFTSNEEPLLGTITANNLPVFDSPAAYEAAKGGAAQLGDIFQEASGKIKYFDGENWQEIVNTQALSVISAALVGQIENLSEDLNVAVQNIEQDLSEVDTELENLSNVDSNLQNQIDNIEPLPPGGAAGQLLTKVDAVPGNATWQDPPVTLPDQTGHAGKFLKSNGLVSSWQIVPDPATVVSNIQTLESSGVIVRQGGRVERVKAQGTGGETGVSIATEPPPQDGDQLFIQGMSNANPILVNQFNLPAGIIAHLMFDAEISDWRKVGGA